MKDIEPDLDQACERVLELMAIPGKSGEEEGVAKFITQRLRRAGAPTTAIERDEV